MSRTGEVDTLDRLFETAAEDWDSTRLFGSPERAVEAYFAAQEKAHQQKAMSLEPKEWDGSIDPAIPIAARRTYAALIFLFQAKPLAGESRDQALTPAMLRMLRAVYHDKRAYTYVAEEIGIDERTLGKWIDKALRIVRSRMNNRGLFRRRSEAA